MNWNKKYFLLVFLIHVLSFCLSAQNKKALEEKRENNLKEIQYTNQLLSKVKKGKQANLQKVLILNKRKNLRIERIENINSEIEYLNHKIAEKRKINMLMQEDLNKIKSNYAEIIRHARKTSNKYQKWQFILSASSFNQAFMRMKYLQQYAEYRKKQAYLIGVLQDIIHDNIVDLDNKIKEKRELFNQKQDEIANLAKEEEEVKEEIASLKGREKKLKAELREKKNIASELEREIQKIIEEERKLANNKFRKLTPEEKLTSNNFVKNKGKLPWPTERGIITSFYGKHEHAVLSGVYIINNGIEISTVDGSIVRVIFEGVVSKVLAIKGANYTVIVRHGDFLTVYQNLVDVMVKSGDHVNTKEPLGRVYTDKNNNCVLHFEIWNELENLNPVDWIIGS